MMYVSGKPDHKVDNAAMIDHIVDLVEERARTIARSGEGLSDAAAPPAGHVPIPVRHRSSRAASRAARSRRSAPASARPASKFTPMSICRSISLRRRITSPGLIAGFRLDDRENGLIAAGLVFDGRSRAAIMQRRCAFTSKRPTASAVEVIVPYARRSADEIAFDEPQILGSAARDFHRPHVSHHVCACDRLERRLKSGSRPLRACRSALGGGHATARKSSSLAKSTPN